MNANALKRPPLRDAHRALLGRLHDALIAMRDRIGDVERDDHGHALWYRARSDRRAWLADRFDAAAGAMKRAAYDRRQTQLTGNAVDPDDIPF